MFRFSVLIKTSSWGRLCVSSICWLMLQLFLSLTWAFRSQPCSPRELRVLSQGTLWQGQGQFKSPISWEQFFHAWSLKQEVSFIGGIMTSLCLSLKILLLAHFMFNTALSTQTLKALRKPCHAPRQRWGGGWASQGIWLKSRGSQIVFAVP